MKIGRERRLVFLLCVCVLFGVFFLPCKIDGVTADAAGEYSFTIEEFSVEMDVSADRTIAVTEEITAYFTGRNSHGIIRDFPLTDGVKYRNISAECDSDDFSPYTQTDDSDYISLYLRGSGVVTGQTRTYTLTYTMIVPVLTEEGYLPLDVIGYGWQTEIKNVSVAVSVPDGLSGYTVYSGMSGTIENGYADVKQAGNVFTITADYLYYGNGITLDLKFEAGVLSTAFDGRILIVLAIVVVLFLIAILLKMFVFRDPIMTKTVNLEAPDNMDPLLMGKLVDNSVDDEDLGAAIFYLADKGFLFIDLTENESNPILYKSSKEGVEALPQHIKTIYYGLFDRRESVRVSSLNNRFYHIANKAKSEVNGQAQNLYRKSGRFCAWFFPLLAVLILGGFGWISGRSIFSDFNYFRMFFFCAVTACISAFVGFLIKQRQFKWKKSSCVLFALAAVALSVLIALFYTLFSDPVFGKAILIICVISVSLFALLCQSFSIRTEEYTRQLGQILGFKQFIVMTERDKIEFMLKEDPELYYRILPYAQVLGVTNAWTEKFKGLSMQPPAYARMDAADVAFNCVVWNRMFRRMNAGFAHNMVSRPSSSPQGGGGGISGGFGGGFGGGGFGGGGGRGC